MVTLLDTPKLQRHGRSDGSEQQTEVRRTLLDWHGLRCASFVGPSIPLWHGSIHMADLEVAQGRLRTYSQLMRRFVR
jgi:hypothetical protein